MRRLIAALSAMLLCGWVAQGQEGHHHELSGKKKWGPYILRRRAARGERGGEDGI